MSAIIYLLYSSSIIYLLSLYTQTHTHLLTCPLNSLNRAFKDYTYDLRAGHTFLCDDSLPTLCQCISHILLKANYVEQLLRLCKRIRNYLLDIQVSRLGYRRKTTHKKLKLALNSKETRMICILLNVIYK